ncbi:MAG: class I SAM-dependent methyltransferase [Caulobacteraceae bacterium]
MHGYYEDKLRTYGHDTRSLGWIPGCRNIRLGVLTGIGNMDGSSVLDVGCGFGDLYGYLKGKGLNVDYTGLDINPDFIDIARKTYPDARFIVADFEDDDVDGEYDWAFASGIFTLRISDNATFIRNILRKMFSICRKGFAANFLSPGTLNSSADTYWQCQPERILKFCRGLSKRVSLRCDYMATEFCVHVYKNDMSDERNVFEEYDMPG